MNPAAGAGLPAKGRNRCSDAPAVTARSPQHQRRQAGHPLHAERFGDVVEEPHHLEGEASPPTITEVADRMAVTHQNVKQIALALERKGFLDILTDERDARVRRLRPARHLRNLWRRRDPGDFEAVVDWTAVLDDGEVDAGVAALLRLRAARGRDVRLRRLTAGSHVRQDAAGTGPHRRWAFSSSAR